MSAADSSGGPRYGIEVPKSLKCVQWKPCDPRIITANGAASTKSTRRVGGRTGPSRIKNETTRSAAAAGLRCSARFRLAARYQRLV